MTTDANQIVDANKKVEATEQTVAEWLEGMAENYRRGRIAIEDIPYAYSRANTRIELLEFLADTARRENWTRGKGE